MLTKTKPTVLIPKGDLSQRSWSFSASKKVKLKKVSRKERRPIYSRTSAVFKCLMMMWEKYIRKKPFSSSTAPERSGSRSQRPVRLITWLKIRLRSTMYKATVLGQWQTQATSADRGAAYYYSITLFFKRSCLHIYKEYAIQSVCRTLCVNVSFKIAFQAITKSRRTFLHVLLGYVDTVYCHQVQKDWCLLGFVF